MTKVLALLRSTRPGTIAFLSDIPDTLRVVANAGQLEQAFLNLALNGCEAMPQGGRLRVRAHGIPAPPDGVTLPPQPAGYVQIDVEDSGCGMTPDVAARMFEPFFTTRGSGGSGLGRGGDLRDRERPPRRDHGGDRAGRRHHCLAIPAGGLADRGRHGVG